MFLVSISPSLLSFQFVRSGTDNVTVHPQVCRLFMILCGFIQVKALNQFRSIVANVNLGHTSCGWIKVVLARDRAGPAK